MLEDKLRLPQNDQGSSLLKVRSGTQLYNSRSIQLYINRNLGKRRLFRSMKPLIQLVDHMYWCLISGPWLSFPENNTNINSATCRITKIVFKFVFHIVWSVIREKSTAVAHSYCPTSWKNQWLAQSKGKQMKCLLNHWTFSQKKKREKGINKVSIWVKYSYPCGLL